MSGTAGAAAGARRCEVDPGLTTHDELMVLLLGILRRIKDGISGSVAVLVPPR